MLATARRDVSEKIKARDEILMILEHTERVDLGTIYSLVREVMGPGREVLVAELVSSLARSGDIQVETETLGPGPRGPVVAYLRRLRPTAVEPFSVVPARATMA